MIADFNRWFSLQARYWINEIRIKLKDVILLDLVPEVMSFMSVSFDEGLCLYPYLSDMYDAIMKQMLGQRRKKFGQIFFH
jgi:hypothetical protein